MTDNERKVYEFLKSNGSEYYITCKNVTGLSESDMQEAVDSLIADGKIFMDKTFVQPTLELIN